MCGLAGYLTNAPNGHDGHLAAVRRMISPITHRGPDDEGTWADAESGVALGFRRLAIIDLSANGHQPMCSESGRFVMVFNGEVYNFTELRPELEALGCRFRGHSDSEVMLAAFERWGVEKSLRRFTGMFAIALWDREERVLHLARDRFGKKPLFVFARPGFVSFGSELKSLVAGPQFDGEVDIDAVMAFLRYLYVPSPQCIYKHVRKLAPGHLMSMPASRGAAEPVSHPFWSVEREAVAGVGSLMLGSDDEVTTACEDLLREAVRSRMVADVPLGAFLSGGVDSSVVVALMQSISDRPVRTFSVGFDEADYDESGHAARVAQHLGTDHTGVRLTGAAALGLVPALPDWFDEPLADPSQLPTFLICREARKEVTVAVSGDGGDEMFGGYNRHVFGERTIGAAARIPKLARLSAAAGIGLLSAASWDRVHRTVSPVLPKRMRHRLPGEKLHKIGMLLGAVTSAAMYRTLRSVNQSPAAFVRGGYETENEFERVMSGNGPLTLLDRMLLIDQLGYLTDDLLAKVDRVSMAVSLEVRVPLLDHRVAEFSWRLPAKFKIRDGETKWILRRVLDRHVPSQLIDRPKMGFSVPIDRWLRGPLKPWAESLLHSMRVEEDGILDAVAVRAAWKTFVSGGAVSGLSMWAVLNFLAWRERWASAA